ncbi:phage portal protein [Microbacterium allomyrinae]|uniref:Phage portal protein n=1 Tax=Microbacterium allomyrinae TaxID=2830666 RepID=A0A9X1LWF6_9MICO|nr:phage portal protein [Microbacterium allomyrinae]MCC2033076.1 phage portal protein [Microbacterium allomyrinae]
MASDVFPPEPFDIAFARFRELDAWYTGDTETLQEIYSGSATVTHQVGGRSFRGGVIGTLSKWWWGQPTASDEKRMKMHLPLAADLCTLSADLLFGEAPQVVFRKPAAPATAETAKADKADAWAHEAQERLDEIVASDEAHAEFLLWGEYAAALGGSYLAVAWDPAVSKHVFPKAYAADCAIPTFRHGRLASVRLWSEFRNGNEVFRLVEDHHPGQVSYALYRGGPKNLGELVPIGSRPETQHYELLRNESDLEVAIANQGALPLDVRIGTGSDRLAVVYMPNARPVRDWRKLGPLAHLGRSDLDGIQDILDKVDQTWSSLMRDVDNGQGRLIVGEDMLDTAAPGEGAKFDSYRQVFTTVGPTLGKAADGGAPIEQVQFDIRVEEHLQIIEALKKEIASALGYSEAHLGIDQARPGDKTATEVTADLSDSERTRDKKAMYAKAALSQWALAALEIDHAVFGGDALGDLGAAPDVVFAPLSQADPEKLARTASLMEGTSSMKERVRIQHSDWDEDEIAAEVKEIFNEESKRAAREPALSPFDDEELDDGGQDS